MRQWRTYAFEIVQAGIRMGLLKLIGCDDETRLREMREEEEQRQGFLRRKAAREKKWNEE